MATSVDPDETAHYEPSHQDLNCLLKSFLVCRAERFKTRSEKIGVDQQTSSQGVAIFEV